MKKEEGKNNYLFKKLGRKIIAAANVTGADE